MLALLRIAAVLSAALSLSACGGSGSTPTSVGGAIDAARSTAGDAIDAIRRDPEKVTPPPPPDAATRPYVYCDAAGRGIDPARENAAAAGRARAMQPGQYGYDALIVPGFTPLDQATPLRIHPTAQARLQAAWQDYQRGFAPLIIVTGGNAHPAGTPFNEAVEMKRYLQSLGAPGEAVLIEPCAQHSHTNLRNAGRLMHHLGLRRALIVTSRDQAMYFSRPRTSSFDGRCLADLGYHVGYLQSVEDPNRVIFVPSGRVFERGRDPLDP